MFIFIKKIVAVFLQVALVASFLFVPQYTAQATATTIFLTDTSATSWTVPSDWNSSNNTIEVIGGGAGGSLGLLGPEFYAVGGGGGAYSKVTNISLTAGATVGIQVGDGGAVGNNGEDTWLCNSTSNCASIAGSAVVVGAKAGTLTSTGGTGGAAASGVGTVKYSGGNGAIAGATFAGAGGGGGAAGPNGDGGDGGLGSSSNGDGGGGGGNGGGYNGADSTGGNAGAGGNNYSNTGGGSAGAAFGHGGDGTAGAGGGGGDYIGLSSGDGGAGQEWDATHGSGGGGGGGPGANQTNPYDKNYGGKGGLYGGGGGGSPMGAVNTGDFAGAQGIIVITYVPQNRRALAKPANNLGLLAYWSFNEGSGTVAGDFSGRGNDATLTLGPVWTNGKKSKGVSFDGENDYAVTTASLSAQTALTVSAWVRPNATLGAYARIIETSFGDGFLLGACDTGTTWNFTVKQVVDGNGNCAGSVRVGEWTHVVGVWDGSQSFIYQNGVQVGSPVSVGASATAVRPFYFGKSFTDSSNYFNGVIDEVRVYNRALSATEILSLNKQGSAIVGGAEKTAVKNGLVAHWTFNGNDVVWSSATAGTAYDRVGGYNGTLTNMNQTTTPARGKIGQGLFFDGVNDSVTTSDLGVGASFTAMAWIKPSNNFGTSGAGIFDTKPGSAGAVRIFGHTGSPAQVCFDIGGNVPNQCTSDSGYGISDWTNEWHHVAVVITGGSNSALYVDGVNVDNESNSVSASSDSFTVGTYNTSNYFSGVIDDVRTYNRALSASEIKQIYRMGTGTLIRPN